jgi:hypothetical protein
MGSFEIGSVNGKNIVIGDHNVQNNFASLETQIERQASRLPDPPAARRALEDLRGVYATDPVDPARAANAASELTAATAGSPDIQDQISELLGRIIRTGPETRR